MTRYRFIDLFLTFVLAAGALGCLALMIHGLFNRDWTAGIGLAGTFTFSICLLAQYGMSETLKRKERPKQIDFVPRGREVA